MKFLNDEKINRLAKLLSIVGNAVIISNSSAVLFDRFKGIKPKKKKKEETKEEAKPDKVYVLMENMTPVQASHSIKECDDWVAAATAEKARSFKELKIGSTESI